ncbi:MAG: hypothetical protein EA408_02135 [Marinilabiliales bacterium]|nr:MAG: hypothetical protein EA408_02135 [Marinilabiliales bacterium]
MKKRNLLLMAALLITAAMFTACEDDEIFDPPTVLTSAGGEIVLAEGVEEYTVEGTVLSDAGVAEIKLLQVTDDGNFQIGNTLTNFENPNSVPYSFTITGITDVMVVKVEATDVEMQTSYSDEITLVYTPIPETHLTDAEEATWQRVGGAAGTGLEEFGLKWTSNVKSMNYAVIAKDEADKFVQLAADAWEEITTLEALEEAVEQADDMNDYREVNVTEAYSEYDDVLATKVGDEYFLILVKSATVDATEDPVIFTINIDYKTAETE